MKAVLKNKKIAVALSLIPLILVCAVIFIFSAQKGDVSSSESGPIADTITGTLFDEMNDSGNVRMIVEIAIRKLAHLSEFAALGFFSFLHFMIYVRKKPWLFAWIFSILYAVSDEIHQMFIPDRAPRVYDVAIDSIGALIGIAVLYLITFIIKRKNIKCN